VSAAETEGPIDISVVVAAYNEERLLPRCLDALARQTGAQRVEVIVVDNASTDDTAKIAREHGAIVLREDQPGAPNAKARGVGVARGRLVAVMDADSVCPPDWLERIVARFDADAGLIGLSGPARYLGGPFWTPLVIWWWYAWWRTLGFFFGRAIYAVGTNVAFRREAYARSSGFDPGVPVGGDEVSLFSALAKLGKTRFDMDLVVDTDARRVELGFLRFFWEVFLIQYVINYTWYRITGRSLVQRYAPGSTLPRR
jgi:glycosyltransferase involved in cell wall biosynthesis